MAAKFCKPSNSVRNVRACGGDGDSHYAQDLPSLVKYESPTALDPVTETFERLQRLRINRRIISGTPPKSMSSLSLPWESNCHE